MSRTTKFTVSHLLLGVLLAGALGCSSSAAKWKFSNMFDLDKGMPWEGDEDDVREGTPVRVDGTWIDTVRHQSGEVPQRGFGGKLLFYEKDSNEPIKVEGQLVVYAFDETNRDPTDNRPTRRYVFPAEQLALHMSVGEAGPSYSFFLPWDNAPGAQKEVSLICRFEPTKGAVCVSEQTRHLLPGAVRPETALAGNQPALPPTGPTAQPQYQQLIYEAQGAPAAGAVQQMSFESTAGQQAAARKMTTTSISLPNHFRMPSGTIGVRAGAANAVPAAPQEPAILPPQNATPLPAPTTPTNPMPLQPAASAFGASFHSTPTRQGFVPIGRAQLGGQLVSPFAGAYPASGTHLAPFQPTAAQPQQTGQPTMNPSPQTTAMPQMTASPQQFAMPQVASGAPGPPVAAPQQQAHAQPGVSATTVSYLSPQDSLRWEQGQRSSGYQPSAPQAPWPPAVR